VLAFCFSHSSKYSVPLCERICFGKHTNIVMRVLVGDVLYSPLRRCVAGLSNVRGQHQLAGDCSQAELQGSRPARGK